MNTASSASGRLQRPDSAEEIPDSELLQARIELVVIELDRRKLGAVRNPDHPGREGRVEEVPEGSEGIVVPDAVGYTPEQRDESLLELRPVSRTPGGDFGVGAGDQTTDRRNRASSRNRAPISPVAARTRAPGGLEEEIENWLDEDVSSSREPAQPA